MCKHCLHRGFRLNMLLPLSLSWNPEQKGGESLGAGLLRLCCWTLPAAHLRVPTACHWRERCAVSGGDPGHGTGWRMPSENKALLYPCTKGSDPYGAKGDKITSSSVRV